MATWQSLYGLDDPVKGSLTEFTSARTAFGTMRDDSQTIQDTFSVFLDGGQYAGKLEGETATMFAQMLTELDNGLDDLPRIAGEAYEVFDDHIGSGGATNTLTWLLDEAEAALGRATLADAELDTLRPQASNLQNQIDGLDEQIADPANEDRKDDLETERDGVQGSLSTVNDNIATQEGILDDEEARWSELHDAEVTLNGNTGDRLDGIDLGDLEDPGFWDKLTDFVGGIVEWAVDFVANIAENLVNLIEAIAEGRWLDALWALKGLLDAALLILGTIALFTGIGAPLFFLAVAALAVTATLAVAQHPNPQTGQVLGWQDVAWSAAGVVMSSAGAFRNLGSANGMRLFTRTTTSVRGAGGRYVSAANGPLKPGSLSTLRTNVGALSRVRTAPRTAIRQILSMPAKKYPWPTSVAAQRALYVRAFGRTAWDARGAAGGVYNAAAPITSQNDYTGNGVDDAVGSVFESPSVGGRNGDGYTGNTEPDTRGARQIVLQARRNPAVRIVPMP